MLTKDQLKEKINQVKQDILNNRDSDNTRMLVGLSEYLNYLEDELKSLDKN